MSRPPLVTRNSQGDVDSVLVARWPREEDRPGGVLRRRIGESSGDELLFEYEAARGDPPVSFTFEAWNWPDPHLSSWASLRSAWAELVTRRIRWAVRAAGILPSLPHPLWSRAIPEGDPCVLVSDVSGLDPELQPLVKAADKALYDLRTSWDADPDGELRRELLHEDPSDEEAGDERTDAFSTAVRTLLARTRFRQRVRDDGTEGTQEVVHLRLAYRRARKGEESGFVCDLKVGPRRDEVAGGSLRPWYEISSTGFAHLWRGVLWGTEQDRSVSEKGRSFVVVPRSELEAREASCLAPGELSVDEEEMQLFRMLGEPSPLALPDPELLRWALGRE